VTSVWIGRRKFFLKNKRKSGENVKYFCENNEGQYKIPSEHASLALSLSLVKVPTGKVHLNKNVYSFQALNIIIILGQNRRTGELHGVISSPELLNSLHVEKLEGIICVCIYHAALELLFHLHLWDTYTHWERGSNGNRTSLETTYLLKRTLWPQGKEFTDMWILYRDEGFRSSLPQADTFLS